MPSPIGVESRHAIYCVTCVDDLPMSQITGPIGPRDEYDAPLHCCVCHRFLGGYLTDAGLLYVEAEMLAGRISAEQAAQYIDHYKHRGCEFKVIETFYGRFDVLGNFDE